MNEIGSPNNSKKGRKFENWNDKSLGRNWKHTLRSALTIWMSWETEEEDLARSERSGKRERRRIARTLGWASIAIRLLHSWRAVKTDDSLWGDCGPICLFWAGLRIDWLGRRRRDHDGPTSPFTPCLKAQLANWVGRLQLLALGIQESSEVARNDKEARQGHIN